MHDVKKMAKHIQSWGVHIARILKNIGLFFRVIHERVK